MIFFNPAGAPELACESCGCRWFDRMTNTCYECSTPVTETMVQEFQAALNDFSHRSGASAADETIPASAGEEPG